MAEESNESLQGKSPRNYDNAFRSFLLAFIGVVIVLLLMSIEISLWPY